MTRGVRGDAPRRARAPPPRAVGARRRAPWRARRGGGAAAGNRFLVYSDGDVVNQVVLPDKTYLVSFNPPNTNMLFLDRNLAIRFLNIIQYTREKIIL